ncbi:elongation of very long chain fatty acids protein AAEL008004-like [Pectinophora gossypiella]|uniref:elongation of very long chain fatty acids protein AAEL008004-like n=1 Tax=Pectinophora gossypiella TaxID=13191 RepID=UPI00214EFEAE|nr:elongation of very long chain fatty acids protein AAEL008004-like [Pectinophora gossypiella]
MTSFSQSILKGYRILLADEYADPRTKDWFLVSSPVPLFVILASYLYFCTQIGPRYMESRKPYELKNLLIVYNAAQVILSAYMVWEGCAVWSTYNWYCEPLDYSQNPVTLRMNNICWVYYMAKITELLDTVFFVLRKKDNQITVLHLFHHTLMPTVTFFGLRYVPTGHGTLFGLINSFVHVIMYSYYLVAGLGPEYQKYLWWKKHLTGLQLVQFVIIFLHNIIPLFTDCGYKKFLHAPILIFSSTFIYMFGNFYVQSYLKKTKTENSNGKNKLH